MPDMRRRHPVGTRPRRFVVYVSSLEEFLFGVQITDPGPCLRVSRDGKARENPSRPAETRHRLMRASFFDFSDT